MRNGNGICEHQTIEQRGPAQARRTALSARHRLKKQLAEANEMKQRAEAMPLNSQRRAVLLRSAQLTRNRVAEQAPAVERAIQSCNKYLMTAGAPPISRDE